MSCGSINDSKGGQTVYGVDDEGQTVAELTLQNIYNRDWEAMAPGVDDGGDPALWIADIGDNDSQWESLRVYRISEPDELGTRTPRGGASSSRTPMAPTTPKPSWSPDRGAWSS